MSKEAMKLALEALEHMLEDAKQECLTVEYWNECVDAITALREALAEQPAQQEPVSNCVECTNADSLGMPDKPCCRTCVSGSEWSPLNKSSVNPNKPAQQEPVAFGALAKRRVFDYIRGAYDLGYSDARNAKAIPGDSVPGYKGRDVEADHGSALLHALEASTSPPTQRTWVGLTDEERIKCRSYDPEEAVAKTEAKLKEKNT